MKIETKYNIGDEVWCYDDEIEMTFRAKIKIVMVDEDYTIGYNIENSMISRYVTESELFPTKEELLKSL